MTHSFANRGSLNSGSLYPGRNRPLYGPMYSTNVCVVSPYCKTLHLQLKFLMQVYVCLGRTLADLPSELRRIWPCRLNPARPTALWWSPLLSLWLSANTSSLLFQIPFKANQFTVCSYFRGDDCALTGCELNRKHCTAYLKSAIVCIMQW